MKKIVIIVILSIIAITSVLIWINNNKAKERVILNFNSEFEDYKKKEMYGADVLTLINKADDNNKNYNIPKNEEGFYIENDQNSVIVELILLYKNEEEEIEEKTYRMENIEKAGLTGFISNFGLTTFKCSNIEYNSQKRVSKITVKQLEM